MRAGQDQSVAPLALTLDGLGLVGYLESVEGGGVRADVVNEPTRPGGTVRKRVARARHDDITVGVSFSMMNPALFGWIGKFFERNDERKAGVIIAADFDYRPMSAREFTDALITEVAVPAMDSGSGEEAYLTVNFSPWTVKYRSGGGQRIEGDSKQKKWISSGFRLRVGDLDTSGVIRIDPFTIRRAAATRDDAGCTRAAEAGGALQFPDLTIYLSESHAEEWFDWAEDFVVEGCNSIAHEKDGAIAFVSPGCPEVELATIELVGAGIKSISPAAVKAGIRAVGKVKVELYVQSMKFKQGRM